MKKIILLFLALLYLLTCSAQETIEHKNRLSDSVIERFYVLKTDKTTKQGAYQAFFKRRVLIASGNYTNNKRTGIWRFFKPNGIHVQTYDYDQQVFAFESPLDTMDDVRYLIDEKHKPTDTITRAVKTGGIYYGFIPYLNIFQLPFDTLGINTDYFDATVELLISPLGRLADYKVHLTSARYQYNQTYALDVNLFSEADKTLVPVTINHSPVLSRIIIKCYVMDDGTLDFY